MFSEGWGFKESLDGDLGLQTGYQSRWNRKERSKWSRVHLADHEARRSSGPNGRRKPAVEAGETCWMLWVMMIQEVKQVSGLSRRGYLRGAPWAPLNWPVGLRGCYSSSRKFAIINIQIYVKIWSMRIAYSEANTSKSKFLKLGIETFLTDWLCPEPSLFPFKLKRPAARSVLLYLFIREIYILDV